MINNKITVDIKPEDCPGWQCVTFADKIVKWAADYKDLTAVVTENENITYEELYRKTLALASFFTDTGINSGDRVVVRLPNTSAFIVSCLALFEIGAIPILALPSHKEKDLDGIFALAKPSAFLTMDESEDYCESHMALNLAKKYHCEKNLIYESVLRVRMDENTAAPKHVDYKKPSYKDTAMLLLSGGTTGTPKLIPRTHGGYIYNMKMMEYRMRLTESDVYLAVLPAAHNFGLGNPGVLGILDVGGTAVMCRYPSPMEIFSLIEKYRVTFLSLVPSLVSMCIQYREIDGSSDISSLKYLLTGGAPLLHSDALKVGSVFGCKLIQVYGIAEGLICTTSPGDTEETTLNTQGKPISDYDDLHIIDGDGEDVEPGTEGELITRGPYTIKGYYRLPEANRKSFNKDGYYLTGDKAKVTKDGNIVITGRADEQINRAGEKIMPSSVEKYLCRHPDVLECSVVGVPDKVLGEAIFAFIKTENKDLTLSQLRAFLSENGVSSYKLIDRMRIIDNWPLTAVKKIDKKKLKLMASQKI